MTVYLFVDGLMDLLGGAYFLYTCWRGFRNETPCHLYDFISLDHVDAYLILYYILN